MKTYEVTILKTGSRSLMTADNAEQAATAQEAVSRRIHPSQWVVIDRIESAGDQNNYDN